ncbi:MAG: 50S ribosomal protein L10 [Planctomycetota bacterium]|jgi:large subunit ribosomal protein L10
MSKPVKAMIMAEYEDRYKDVSNACVVDLTGLTVQEQQQIRGSLREKSARVQIIKNSLARKAFKDTPIEALGDALSGPCALVTTSESLIDAAKVLVAAAKEFENLTLKEAVVEGDLFTVTEVSKMKGRLELLGEVAMLVASPGRALAGCLSSPQGKIAGCLKKMIEDKEAA